MKNHTEMPSRPAPRASDCGGSDPAASAAAVTGTGNRAASAAAVTGTGNRAASAAAVTGTGNRATPEAGVPDAADRAALGAAVPGGVHPAASEVGPHGRTATDAPARMRTAMAVSNAAGTLPTPLFRPGSPVSDKRFWRWGDDNLFPYALALMSRRSTTHRRIINDKADYISGKGFTCDPARRRLADFTARANGAGESLRQVIGKLAFDKCLLGNAFVEVVTDPGRRFLSLFHQDASKCRLARDGEHVLLHHDWSRFTPADARSLPLWPALEQAPDGTLRAMIHYKDYEPMFEHYGVPPYIAGMNVSAIAYKTDCWNISRLDNSFQLSGVMLLDGSVDSEAQAEKLVRDAETRFAGKPGQVMFLLKECAQGDSSRFIPIDAQNEGDWKGLHEQAVADIVVAHSWFRSLSGLDYGTGFDSQRILHEYEVALNTVILTGQSELLEPLREVMEAVLVEDCSSLQIVNQPPTRSKPLYMKVWEARRADGLDYDENDPLQQLFVAQITKYGMRNID